MTPSPPDAAERATDPPDSADRALRIAVVENIRRRLARLEESNREQTVRVRADQIELEGIRDELDGP